MPINLLSKILFPRHADWQRRKFMRLALWVVAVTVCFAAVVAALMLLANSKR